MTGGKAKSSTKAAAATALKSCAQKTCAEGGLISESEIKENQTPAALAATSSACKRKRRSRAKKQQDQVYIAFWTGERCLVSLLVEIGKLERNLVDDPKAITAATKSLVEGLAVGVLDVEY